MPHQPPKPTLFPYTTLFRSLFTEVAAIFAIYFIQIGDRDIRARLLIPVLCRLTHPSGISKLLLSCIRSEEHTSELQSRGHLVCRLLLDKNEEEGYLMAERNK